MKSSGLPSARLDDDAVGDDLGREAARPHQRARRQADERVAAEALAADDRFEQEAQLAAVRSAAARVGELEVQRQRRLEVGEGLGDQRNAVVALRGKALEFELGDHAERPSTGRAARLRVGRMFIRSVRRRCRRWSRLARGARPTASGCAQARAAWPRQGQAPRSADLVANMRGVNIGKSVAARPRRIDQADVTGMPRNWPATAAPAGRG